MVDVITVSALNKYTKTLLEADPVLTDIAIRGEISNFNRHFKTGHCYFSLKDEKASVRVVLFQSYAANLAFSPENGHRVVVRGRVTLYERDGTFQIYAEWLFLDGEGAIRQAFEQLKRRLDTEGLFAAEHKKPLPAFPQRIGVVTSKTGAAWQDILNVASRRCPFAHFLLCPVGVQGEGAAPGIAGAVKQLDGSGVVDVIIVARGGGSTEDLWVFNSEEIARAVYGCRTPVISAVGHEIDFTIIDFVADVRAPTPSAAAELALPDVYAVQRGMEAVFMNIAKNMHLKLDSCYNEYAREKRHLSLRRAEELADNAGKRLDSLARAISTSIQETVRAGGARFSAAAALAESLNPYGVLARGYAVVRKDGAAVSGVSGVAVGDQIDVRFRDGHASARVLQVTPNGPDECGKG